MSIAPPMTFTRYLSRIIVPLRSPKRTAAHAEREVCDWCRRCSMSHVKASHACVSGLVVVEQGILVQKAVQIVL